jgi:LmbE family N-acetylglucosaminyl deacetylase
VLKLRLEQFDPPLREILCVGAHCDDLEIGCGGAVLKLTDVPNPPAFTWVVFSSDSRREAEAMLRSSFVALHGRASSSRSFVMASFRTREVS